MHTDDATGFGGFQEVLGRHCHGKNKECMAKLMGKKHSATAEVGVTESTLEA